METASIKHKKRKKLPMFLLSVAALLASVAGIYAYICVHYWQADYDRTLNAGFMEKQIKLDNMSVINYAEGPDNGSALLLIHGQTGAWEDYTRVLPELSKNWHVFAVDCYGHGGSSHDEQKYYLDANGDDLIWFVNQVIGKETVVSGHSSGGLLAAYVAAYGGDLIAGAVLEDPPVFSTESENWENSFAYQDTYKTMHNYLQSEQAECWEAYYMRHCLWGKLYMANAMDGLANYAQQMHNANPDRPIQYFFMPESVNFTFLYTQEYDMQFGEHFYDGSWHSGIAHSVLMENINVPAIFMHASEAYSEDNILMAASSNAQAREAARLIGDCELIELESNHDIHRFNAKVFINAINKMRE